jgi:hypothetical protein
MTEVETESYYSSAANGGQALRRRWSRRLSSGKHIIRIYWPAILFTLTSVAFYLWMLHLLEEQRQSHYYGPQMDWAYMLAIGLFGLNFVVRMQLACIPAMAALPDFDRLRWPSLRTTAISSGEIFRAIFLHTLIYNVLLLGLLGLLGTVIVLALQDDEYRRSLHELSTTRDVIYSVLGYSVVGFSLSGLGFIASFKWDKPIAVIGGVFIPVLLLIFVGTVMLVQSGYLGYYNESDSWLYVVDVLTMLVVPEGFIGSGLMEGQVYLPSGDQISLLAWMLIEFLIAFVIWQFVAIALNVKRAADK